MRLYQYKCRLALPHPQQHSHPPELLHAAAVTGAVSIIFHKRELFLSLLFPTLVLHSSITGDGLLPGANYPSHWNKIMVLTLPILKPPAPTSQSRPSPHTTKKIDYTCHSFQNIQSTKSRRVRHAVLESRGKKKHNLKCVTFPLCFTGTTVETTRMPSSVPKAGGQRNGVYTIRWGIFLLYEKETDQGLQNTLMREKKKKR